jgi:group I intron endonuclease
MFLSLYLYLWEEKKYTQQKNNKMNKQDCDQNDTTKKIKNKSVKKECVGIYGLKNKINGKWYVGQSVRSITDRWSSYKNLQCDSQPKLFNAIVKYGYENFEKIILEECEADQSILDSREDYWIRYHNSVENGYNCRYGGANGSFSDETKQKVKDGCKRKIYSDELRKKLSDGGKKSKGRIVSEKTKLKMQIVHKARYENNQSAKTHIQQLAESNKMINRGPVTAETRQKISNASKGKIISERSKEKLSTALLEYYKQNEHNWNGKSHTDDSKAKMAMYIWITDGTQSKRHIRTEPIPVGYKKGRLYKRKLIEP